MSIEFALVPNVDGASEEIAQNVYDEVGEVAEDYDKSSSIKPREAANSD
jgi:hypothetical protein